MDTKTLARSLGLVETLRVDKIKEIPHSRQLFKYLIVLDFESTCWDRNDAHHPPEIIEFPAVLYRVDTGEIVEEFRQYVMPTEYPRLSDFCTSFTGIQQEQVENGVPIGTCLMLFARWLKLQEEKHQMQLHKENSTNSYICVTWSDWDLGTCLHNECLRKRIKKLEVFTKWIDLRALFQEFYNHRPQGLNGALNHAGLKFIGRQHCGLDDATNTAHLAGRMISDGMLLRITKQIAL